MDLPLTAAAESLADTPTRAGATPGELANGTRAQEVGGDHICKTLE